MDKLSQFMNIYYIFMFYNRKLCNLFKLFVKSFDNNIFNN